MRAENVKKFLAHIASLPAVTLICNRCEIIIMLRIVSVIFVLAALTSCKTIHNLTSKDNSTENKNATAHPKTKQNGNVVFMENIEVTPGNTVTSRQTLKTIKAKRKDGDKKIESVDALQLKYAIILDATVEKLTNIALLQSIDKWWGTRYCLGGNTTSCIDCSAFTKSVMKDVYNVDLSRTAQEQFDNSQHIEMEDLQEGDLVFFQTTGRKISHVGIYLLNNKFVHAAVSQGVSVSDLNDTYWRSRYRGAGRMVLNEINTNSIKQ